MLAKHARLRAGFEAVRRLSQHDLELALERGRDRVVQERRALQPARDHLEEAADQQALGLVAR